MNILVTGSKGFIGRNLVSRLISSKKFNVIEYGRSNTTKSLIKKLRIADYVVHLAGENKSRNADNFIKNNTNLTKTICQEMVKLERSIPMIFSSSTQVGLNNIYGKSKLNAEKEIENYFGINNNPVTIFRLPGVFGKWCKPNYNSVVATFCYRIANNKKINIINPSRRLPLIYIDDVVNQFINKIINPPSGIEFQNLSEVFEVSISEIAKKITNFHNNFYKIKADFFENKFDKNLYSTFISYIPKKLFKRSLSFHSDDRGVFAELLRSDKYGQISFFSAKPGITRGNHVHDSKTEKFYVIKGKALFTFKNLYDGEINQIESSSDDLSFVQSIPGWAHNIKNIGSDELLVILWANEPFDNLKPDTIPYMDMK